ncbi:MAG: Response regulator protein TmoT [Ignavibacteriaceae bacterium]|nr:Response regulator protein TmoT [Ignavibacteriaceae bacterium]MEB2296466.1 response regulator [Ignavibacteria bacterium]NUM62941.1 response regulator transcription factor [Ignavibacteriaceae bacterium]
MNKSDCKIFLIDDDEEIRQSLALLLGSTGYQVESFISFEEFLEKTNHIGPGCIILDVILGGKTGLELQTEIEMRFESFPIIFITGHGNIPMSVEALKKGAINFLEKPIDERNLINAIEEALSRSLTLNIKYSEIDKIKSLVSSLTAREYEIFRHVITGMLNKQIAVELGIAEHTVKNHRLKITEKLRVKTVPEMIYMADKLSLRTSIPDNSK